MCDKIIAYFYDLFFGIKFILKEERKKILLIHYYCVAFALREKKGNYTSIQQRK